MASVLPAIGRRSPCAITRFMCSSGVARNQTVKQRASSRSNVAGSDTMPPPVDSTARGWLAIVSSSARTS